MRIATKRWPWAVLAVAGLAVVLRVTLVPTSDPDTGTFHTCLLCGELGLSDFVGNVLLFMPLAAGLYLAGVRGHTTVAALFLLSGAIELAQLWIPGRESALGDLVSNTLGAAAGVGVAWWLPRRRRTAAGSLAAAAAALAVFAIIGALFAPSFPRNPYYGQWTPDLGMYGVYGGKVLGAALAGRQLPSWRLNDSGAARLSLLADSTVRVRAVAGPPPGALAPIFNIFDSRRNEILLLGADRVDLVTHVRLRATDALLRQPDLRWRGVLGSVKTGDTIALAFRRQRPGYCLALNGLERCGLAYTLGRAWGFVQFPNGLSERARRALDALFMAGLGLCVGLLLKRGTWSGIAGGAVVLGAVAAPALLGLAVTPVPQVAGLGAGLLAGIVLP